VKSVQLVLPRKAVRTVDQFAHKCGTSPDLVMTALAIDHLREIKLRRLLSTGALAALLAPAGIAVGPGSALGARIIVTHHGARAPSVHNVRSTNDSQ
jgi:hypothetical protein